MRSVAAVAALFAAGALAGPLNNAHQHLHKRDYVVVTDIDIVYETVYVTEGEAAPATSVPVATSTSVVQHAAPTPAVNIVNTGAPAAAQPAPAQVNTPAAQAPAPAPVQPATSTAAAPSTYSSSSSSSGPINLDDYSAAVVLHHNVHRANHSAPNLQWDDNLASLAQQAGETCYYAHHMGLNNQNYGQNIAAGCHADNVSTILTDMFYNGEMPNYAPYYGADNPALDEDHFGKYGHFTQLVWKGTTHVGCATVDCTGKNWAGEQDVSNVAPYFTVCNYGPAGNMGGDFGKNVGEPLGHAGVTWSYTG